MKKSTKIIATVIAVTLVITAMLVAIYAATAGNANISANVSWTAQAGVDLEFWANVVGGSENKEIAKTTITPTTTNTDANIVGDLSCNFTDTTDDGVNNPNAIKFTYYVRNKSLTPLNIRVTKTPAEAEESGTNAETHKPRVVLTSETDGTSTLTAVSSTSGYDLKAGDIFSYTVVLSLASGGKGTINADTGFGSAFDAGVTFNFNVGGDSNGTIVTSVDGASPTSVSSSSLTGQTLGEYLTSKQTAEYSTGWFFDEGLTKVVSDDYLEVSLSEASNSSLYCKTASIEGLSFELDSETDTYLVKSDGTASGDIVIPNMYEGKLVTGFTEPTTRGSAVFDSAFFKVSNIITITMPNSIKNISDYAFTHCTGLTSMTIPSSVINIGFSAFQYCTALIDFTVYAENIGNSMLSNCDNILNITIGSNVKNIGSYAFQNCSNLTSIKLPNGVATIKDRAFYSCDSLLSMVIPSSVTSIGTGIFECCSGLMSIEVDNKNAVYDSRNDCNAIIKSNTNEIISGCKNTIIPNSVISIGQYAFYECGLTSIEIPDSVTSIGNYAFSSCTGLTSIEIPNSVTSIGNSVFASCKELKSITIPDSVTSMGNDVFNNCIGLTSAIIGDGVTRLESAVFKSCEELISIDIGKNVTYIKVSDYSDSPFVGCTKLTNIKVDSKNQKYDSRNNCNAIIETATNKLVVGCKATVIPESVTSIADYAFRDMSSLISIIIPDLVTSIGNYAFEGCSGLTSIAIPDKVTSIGKLAFKGCTALTDMTIGNNVQTIGQNAFWGCTGLTVVNIPDSVISIDELAFRKCSGLTSVTIGSGVKSIGREAFVGCSGLIKIFIPASVTTIDASYYYYNSPFRDCSSTLQIYCEASEKPSGWGTYWNYYASGKTLDVTWGVTRAQFDAL